MYKDKKRGRTVVKSKWRSGTCSLNHFCTKYSWDLLDCRNIISKKCFLCKSVHNSYCKKRYLHMYMDTNTDKYFNTLKLTYLKSIYSWHISYCLSIRQNFLDRLLRVMVCREWKQRTYPVTYKIPPFQKYLQQKTCQIVKVIKIHMFFTFHQDVCHIHSLSICC